MRENTSIEWVNKEVDSEGNFNRQKNQFETPFGEGEGKLPVEPGRYRLLWAPVCPWAHRSVIVRKLLGLEDVISLGTADPKRPDVPRSDWAFTLDERQMADRLIVKLKELGFEVEEDNAGGHFGGNAGNLYAYLPGDLPGDPVLLSGHMDTVEPSKGKKGIIGEDGVIRSAGKAVLGADDVAGLVEILEGIRSVKEAGVPHRDIEILFAIAEELYIKGSSVFDFSKVRAKEAYVLDISGPVGSAAYKAPSLISYQVVVTGKASHAGFDPEHGVHAIAIASEAITQISQGHVDEETTCNIGLIEGGSGTNIVPEKCIVKGEIRSYSHEKATRCVEEVGNTFKKVAEKHGAESELTCEVHLIAYETAKDSVPVKRFERVSKELGLAGNLVETFGGSDNNSFAKNGIPGLVLSNGMYQAHSVNEYTTIKDLVTGAELIAGLITDEQ